MIVLDTHAWIWWVSGSDQLSSVAKASIRSEMDSGEIAISAISSWEVAMLSLRGRLELTLAVDDWIAHTERLPFVTFVPIDYQLALSSVALPDLHRDPADRFIVATARFLGAVLVTKDRRLREYPQVETVW